MGWILPEHEGYEGDGDNQHVEQVESAPTEGVFMQDEPVGDDLQDQLDGEDGGEEVVKIIQNLEKIVKVQDYAPLLMDVIGLYNCLNVLHYSSATAS